LQFNDDSGVVPVNAVLDPDAPLDSNVDSSGSPLHPFLPKGAALFRRDPDEMEHPPALRACLNSPHPLPAPDDRPLKPVVHRLLLERACQPAQVSFNTDAEEEVLTTTRTKCSRMGLNRGTYSVPNRPVVCILGGPNSDDYGSNRSMLPDIHVVVGGLSNPDPDDPKVMGLETREQMWYIEKLKQARYDWQLPCERGDLATTWQPAWSLTFTVGNARLAVHVASQCQQASSRDTQAMATMAKKSVGDLTEDTIIARLCTYTTFHDLLRVNGLAVRLCLPQSSYVATQIVHTCNGYERKPGNVIGPEIETLVFTLPYSANRQMLGQYPAATYVNFPLMQWNCQLAVLVGVLWIEACCCTPCWEGSYRLLPLGEAGDPLFAEAKISFLAQALEDGAMGIIQRCFSPLFHCSKDAVPCPNPVASITDIHINDNPVCKLVAEIMGFSIFPARLGLPVKDEDGPEGIFTNRKAVEAHQFTIWPFGQTVSGHFFPNGGYHAGQNMVLILDVARFKYPLHWVPLQLILEAMNTTDNSTGGFMLISRKVAAPSLLHTVSCRDENWKSVSRFCVEDLPSLRKVGIGTSVGLVTSGLSAVRSRQGNFSIFVWDPGDCAVILPASSVVPVLQELSNFRWRAAEETLCIQQ
jgi:hypothetical protein